MTEQEKDDLRERIHRLVDGDLSPDEATALRRLLRDNEEGQELLRSLEALHAALPEWKTPSPSDSFVGRVVLAIERDQAARGKQPVHLRRISVGRFNVPLPVAAAAAALLVISAAFSLRGLLSSSGKTSSPLGPTLLPVSDQPINSSDDGGLDFPFAPPGSARPGSPGNPILILDPLDEPGKDADKDADPKKEKDEDGEPQTGAEDGGSR